MVIVAALFAVVVVFLAGAWLKAFVKATRVTWRATSRANAMYQERILSKVEAACLVHLVYVLASRQENAEISLDPEEMRKLARLWWTELRKHHSQATMIRFEQRILEGDEALNGLFVHRLFVEAALADQ